MPDEGADARERRSRADSQQRINRRRPVIGDVSRQYPPQKIGKHRMNSREIKIAASISAFVIITAVAVSHGQSSKNDTSVDVQKAVLARLAEIQSAAQSLDPDKVFDFVLENDAGALAQNGKLFLTRKEALESTKQGFQGLQDVSYRFDEQHVTLLSPTVALAAGEGSSSATLLDGRTLTTRFAQSVVLVLTNGEWKVFHAHRSFPRQIDEQ
ncbi:MAG: nuclear transport factor 2 family protein [Pirellulaceae bacterium]